MSDESKRKNNKAIFYHLCMDIEGAIHNQDFDGFKKEDGSKASRAEAFSFLIKELKNGRSVIPVGNCDNFDYETGCLGHFE